MRLYRRLDELREQTATRLRSTRRSRAGGTPASRSERDALAARDEDRLAELYAVDDGLCFGRLDLDDGQLVRLGRIGLSDEEQQRILVDWRAPAAAPFYRATARTRMGVVRRRHLRTRGRDVVGVDDEPLDLAKLADSDRARLTGESALLAALAAPRTGVMRDAVATLQAEQDEVIRDDLAGVLVVQGGPGTGKTVVALHRAAYLLYTYRERLGRSGVLVVGPGRPFLRYVEQVLPALGERAVVLAAVGELYPGIDVTGTDRPAAARLKGDPRMVAFVRAAVRGRQVVPRQPIALKVDGHELELDLRTIRRARDRARDSRRPHNTARNIAVRAMLEHLARQMVGQEGWDELEGTDRDAILRDLIREAKVRTAINGIWPHLTAEQLLTDLYASEDRLAAAGAGLLHRAETAALRRAAPGPEESVAWTEGDVPLLDEAAELLGETDPWARREAAREEAARRRETRYAQEVLSTFGGGGPRVDASTLAERYGGGGFRSGRLRDVALGDREWVYGHVVVDEAQDVSPMVWRLLARRCPTRSMTVVGDLAQGGSAWSPASWGDALEPHAPDAWRVRELTIGYRTPRQVMGIATRVLAELDDRLSAPQAIRDGSEEPVVTATDDLRAAAAHALSSALDKLGEGRLAVIGPAPLLDVLRTEAEQLAPGRVGDPSTEPVAVLAARDAKGLEFDAVVLVDPGAIVAASERGLSDAYVALTRTTDRLTVVARDPLPPWLA